MIGMPFETIGGCTIASPGQHIKGTDVMTTRFYLVALALLLGMIIAGGAARAADRHVGYYYPKPAAIEVYRSRAKPLPDAGRRQRVGFVVGIVTDMLKRPFPPNVSLFVKGDEAEKLIIVSNVGGRLDTIYRVRALLATLTSGARTTPVFHDYRVEDWFTFLDLLRMLGFERVTVSDGDAFAHQILIQ